MILTEILKNFRRYKDQEGMKKLIKKTFDEIYKSQISDLEDFNVFDIFESSETFKAKTPQIIFSSLCQDFFTDITNDKVGCSLPLFELFEEYLLSSKDKIFLFKSTTANSLTEFNEINRKFILARKSKIEAILEENKNTLSKYYQKLNINKLVGYILLSCLALITIVASNVVYKGNREKIVFQPPYASVMTIENASVTSDVLMTKNAPFASITDNLLNSSPFGQSSKARRVPISQLRVHSQQNSKPSTPASQKVTYNAPKVASLSKTSAIPVVTKAVPLKKLQPANVSISQDVAVAKKKLNNTPKYKAPVIIVMNTVINGAKTEANIRNTVGTYQDLGKVKEHFARSFENATSPISVQTTGVDRQHVNIESTRNSLTIPRNQGACHILPTKHHVLVTPLMDCTVPFDCGYGNKKDLLEYHDILATRYDKMLDSVYDTNPGPKYLIPNGIIPVKDLEQYGVTPDEVKVSGSQAFAQERTKIVLMEIPKDVLFPWSHANSINVKQVEAFNTFSNRFNPGDSEGLANRPKRASIWIAEALKNGREASEHYYAVLPILKPGSHEFFVANKNYEAHMVAAENAIYTVRHFGGVVNSELERDYFVRNPTPKPLSDAEEIAMNSFNLRNPKKGCKSVFPGYHK